MPFTKELNLKPTKVQNKMKIPESTFLSKPSLLNKNKINVFMFFIYIL